MVLSYPRSLSFFIGPKLSPRSFNLQQYTDTDTKCRSLIDPSVISMCKGDLIAILCVTLWLAFIFWFWFAGYDFCISLRERYRARSQFPSSGDKRTFGIPISIPPCVRRHRCKGKLQRFSWKPLFSRDRKPSTLEKGEDPIDPWLIVSSYLDASPLLVLESGTHTPPTSPPPTYHPDTHFLNNSPPATSTPLNSPLSSSPCAPSQNRLSTASNWSGLSLGLGFGDTLPLAVPIPRSSSTALSSSCSGRDNTVTLKFPPPIHSRESPSPIPGPSPISNSNQLPLPVHLTDLNAAVTSVRDDSDFSSTPRAATCAHGNLAVTQTPVELASTTPPLRSSSIPRLAQNAGNGKIITPMMQIRGSSAGKPERELGLSRGNEWVSEGASLGRGRGMVNQEGWVYIEY